MILNGINLETGATKHLRLTEITAYIGRRGDVEGFVDDLGQTWFLKSNLIAQLLKYGREHILKLHEYSFDKDTLESIELVYLMADFKIPCTNGKVSLLEVTSFISTEHTTTILTDSGVYTYEGSFAEAAYKALKYECDLLRETIESEFFCDYKFKVGREGKSKKIAIVEGNLSLREVFETCNISLQDCHRVTLNGITITSFDVTLSDLEGFLSHEDFNVLDCTMVGSI